MRKKKTESGQGVSGGSAGAPDAAGAEHTDKIGPVELSLHSNGVDHWQDEEAAAPHHGTDQDRHGVRPGRARRNRSSSRQG